VLFGLGLLTIAPIVAYAQTRDTVVVVQWNAPGDDGWSGTATSYDLRYSESPITSSNFSSATRVTDLPAPRSSGTRQRVTVRGLTPGTTYYFALRTQDNVGNWSQISNVARWDWNFDTAPPAAPSGLTAAMESGSVRLQWLPNGEPDLRGYVVYRALAASGPFTSLNPSPLTANEFVDTEVPSGSEQVWYQVTATDVSGNESAKSRVLSLHLVVAENTPTVEAIYPNPSRASSPVSIPVVIPSASVTRAEVDVLDAGGALVRRIEFTSAGPGRQVVVWDGKNDAGRQTVPGVYRAWLIAGDTRKSIRLLRLP